MNALQAKIEAEIAREGPISLARYMALCLTDPEHGYYRHGTPIGAKGDFTTAPEISQMFGELLGLWCAVTWRQMGAPSAINLVELGPGRGSLMADCLRAGRQIPDFVPACALHLVEAGEDLRAAQRGALQGYDVCWHEDFATVPAGPALIIANEFFDALPVRQFIRADLGWVERLIEPGLSFGQGVERHEMPESLANAPAGSIVEISPAREELASQIARRIAAEGGAALIIDYGHARSGIGDTLQAVRRHAPHDPLKAPGEVDLTTHVDFEALERAADGHDVAVHGPISQRRFLRALGIDARAAMLMKRAEPGAAAEIEGAHNRLTAPSAMGELFQALAICGPGLPTPAGFEALATQVERRAAWS